MFFLLNKFGKNTHTQVTECMIELLGAIKVSLGLTERPFGMQVALLWYSFATVRVMSAKGTDLCSGETTRGDPLLFGSTKIQTLFVTWMHIFTKVGSEAEWLGHTNLGIEIFDKIQIFLPVFWLFCFRHRVLFLIFYQIYRSINSYGLIF